MEETRGSGERKRILYSDDEQALCEAMKSYLESEGYEVRLAPDPLEAIEVAQSWQPDLITTDVMKPIMSGLDMLRRLKADERTKHIPVIVLSASMDDPERRQRAMDLGASVTIAKPFDPADYLETLREILGEG